MHRVLERVRRLRNVAFASQIRPRLPSRLHLTPDSHSTGHSPIRPRLDTEWYMLRLLEEVRRQLVSSGNNKNPCLLDHLWEPDDFYEPIHHHNPARQRSFNPCRQARTQDSRVAQVQAREESETRDTQLGGGETNGEMKRIGSG
ncbi:hypothetical protein PS2_007139 [Malus domestica]|uniref:Uncharacterized protein n=1 Tax=Malus baccata TaxID=106549 RepID=A0A540LXY9_MALBA|nr:hypothetical protein C1H46_023307 [Malus baccata]